MQIDHNLKQNPLLLIKDNSVRNGTHPRLDPDVAWIRS